MICNAQSRNTKCSSENKNIRSIKTAANKSLKVNQKKISKASEKAEVKSNNHDKVVTASSGRVLSSLSFYYPFIGRITSNFGSRWGKKHDGIDIAASQGTPIHASAGGTVSFAGWESGYGNMVKINHGNQIQTCYGHCSKILVKQGQHVNKGDIIARVGSTGHSTGPHVHFEIRLNGVAKNPLDYLKRN